MAAGSISSMSMTTNGAVPPAEARYRGDIDGLRAVSIGAVVLFHAGVSRFAGGYVGVDVFFVISGFLITGLMLREIERSGRVSMSVFYARRIRRLLPMSAVTIITTLAAGVWLLPPVARQQLVDDARAATLYIANWRYAGQATAYSDTEVTDSLLVHFWSLAIEEQFYVLWPILIFLGLTIARFSGRHVRPILGFLLGALGVVSLVLSITITNAEGVGAYYLTHTRLWEMAAGAGLALGIHRIPSLPTRALDLLGVVGLGLITFAAITFDATTPFPGSNALYPVIGCLAVLIAGSQEPGVVARALATSPLRLVGRLSYGWYLWHWPAIGISLLLRDRYEWGLGVGATTAAAVAVSFGLAWISHHTIENPVRHASWLRVSERPNYVLAAALTAIPLVFGAVLIANVDRGDTEVVRDEEGREIVLTQTPAEAAEDQVHADARCHLGLADVVPADDCVFGDPNGDLTVVVLGDSHARQWIDAIDQLGQEEGWRVHSITKSACAIVDVSLYLPSQARPYDECDTWRSEATARVAEIGQIDVAILARAATQVDRVLDGDRIVPAEEVTPFWSAGFERTAATFSELADKVVLLIDTPWPGFSPPACLSDNPDDITECSFTLAEGRRDLVLVEAERDVAEAYGVRVVNPVPLVCEADPCTVVSEEGIILYRDTHHLTRTYTLTLLDDIRTWVTD